MTMRQTLMIYDAGASLIGPMKKGIHGVGK